MRYYLAPMEGITGWVYRNVQCAMFPSFDKYITPFIAPKQDKTLNARERKDILPENNRGICVVPQILSNRAEDFIRTARELADYGYREVNLNLGCPSATVVTKKKGAGFLEEPERLKAFLGEIFDALDMDISIKTRLGMSEAEEFGPLLEIFNAFPLKELIIHPRVREDYYENAPDWEAFGKSFGRSASEVVYNGNLFCRGDAERLDAAFPGVKTVMLGRGAVADPSLIRQMKGGERLTAKELVEFSGRLVEGYRAVSSGERDVLFKMKELWFYLAWMFEDCGKYLKDIRKAQRLCEYEAAVRRLCRECRMNGVDSGIYPEHG